MAGNFIHMRVKCSACGKEARTMAFPGDTKTRWFALATQAHKEVSPECDQLELNVSYRESPSAETPSDF